MRRKYHLIFPFLDNAFKNYRSPLESESWQSELFDFSRHVKAIGQLRNLRAVEALQIVESWMAERDLHWDDFPGVEGDEDGRADFVSSWMGGRFAYGEDSLHLAFRELQQIDEQLDPSQHPLSETYRKFLKLCFCLYQVNGGGSIVVPVERFGELLGVSPRTIGTYRDVATEQEILLLLNGYSKEGRRASEYTMNIAALRWV